MRSTLAEPDLRNKAVFHDESHGPTRLSAQHVLAVKAGEGEEKPDWIIGDPSEQLVSSSNRAILPVPSFV